MAHRTEARGARRWSLWRELPVLFVVALTLALLIKAFAVQSFRIPSGSMEDTLRIGDWVLVNKMVYHFREVDRGDIVVFNGQGSWDPPAREDSSAGLAPRLYHDVLRWVGLETGGTDYIKRVIGLPGDHVMCCDSDGRIRVNGVPLSERSYLYPGSDPSVQQFKIVVPSGRVWVMGDHRADSADSRYHMHGPGDGTIPLNQVVGRAFVVFWPLSQLQTLSIPKTFEQSALRSSGISGAVRSPGVSSGISGAVRSPGVSFGISGAVRSPGVSFGISGAVRSPGVSSGAAPAHVLADGSASGIPSGVAGVGNAAGIQAGVSPAGVPAGGPGGGVGVPAGVPAGGAAGGPGGGVGVPAGGPAGGPGGGVGVPAGGPGGGVGVPAGGPAGGTGSAAAGAATPAVPLAGVLGVMAPGLWLPRRFRRIPRRNNARRVSVAGRICEHRAVSISPILPGQTPTLGRRRRCCSRPGISSFRWMTSSCHASLRWRSHPGPAASRRSRRRNVTGATTRRTLRIRGTYR